MSRSLSHIRRSSEALDCGDLVAEALRSHRSVLADVARALGPEADLEAAIQEVWSDALEGRLGLPSHPRKAARAVVAAVTRRLHASLTR